MTPRIAPSTTKSETAPAAAPETASPARPDPTGGIVADLVKAVVIVRVFFIYPVVIAWVTTGPGVVELAVTVLLAAESLIVLLRWNRTAGFIQRHPLILSIDILLAVTVLAFAGADSPFFLYLCATAVLIGLIYISASRILLTILVFLAYGGAALTRALMMPAATTAEVASAVVSVAGGFALLGVLVYLGSTLRRLQSRVDSAIDLTRRNASEAALGEERSRIAQELHDSTVKSLVGIDMLARAIHRSPETANSNARLISTAAAGAVTDSRRILANLQLTTLPPLESSLEALAAEYETLYGVRFRLELGDHDELPLPIRYTARKIAEEAMSNAARHSGAEQIVVRLEQSSESIDLRISDDGIGIPADRQAGRLGHYGLAGMRERAGNHGCTLRIESPPSGGTTVTLTIPRRTGNPHSPQQTDPPQKADPR